MNMKMKRTAKKAVARLHADRALRLPIAFAAGATHTSRTIVNLRIAKLLAKSSNLDVKKVGADYYPCAASFIQERLRMSRSETEAVEDAFCAKVKELVDRGLIVTD